RMSAIGATVIDHGGSEADHRGPARSPAWTGGPDRLDAFHDPELAVVDGADQGIAPGFENHVLRAGAHLLVSPRQEMAPVVDSAHHHDPVELRRGIVEFDHSRMMRGLVSRPAGVADEDVVPQ